MAVLGLDISKTCTGFAYGEAGAPPISGTFAATGSDVGEIGYRFSRVLRDILDSHDFTHAAIEQPFIAKTDDLYRAQLMLGLGMLAQTTLRIKKIPYSTVAPQSWRKYFVGNGRPKDPKGTVIRFCDALGWPVEGDDNRADACGIWAWAHYQHGDARAIGRQMSKMTFQRVS